jgi:membrane protein
MSSDVLRYIASIGPLGHVLEQVARLSSIAVIVFTFAFIYAFLPNTRVRFWPSVIGGLFAGGMWIVIGWGFASFIVSSAKYTVIYSAFATLVLFMIWLYLVWLMLLVGSAVSFYVQNPQYIGIRRDTARYAITLSEKVALVAVYFIVHDWYQGNVRWTTDRLANEISLPMPVLVNVLDALEKAGLIRSTVEEDYFVPACPPEMTPMKTVLDAVRNDEGTGHPGIGSLSAPRSVESVIKRMDDAVDAELGSMTVKDFVLAPESEAILRDAVG